MIKKRIVLKFPHHLVEQPIVCNLVKEYELEFNILKAYVTPNEEGLMVLELRGQDDNYQNGINYLSTIGVEVQLLSQDVIRNDSRCTQCGMCVGICPTSALAMDPATRIVSFYKDKCIACELCVPTCPAQALEVHF